MASIVTNKLIAADVKMLADAIEKWYYLPHSGDVHPINEIAYACCGVLKECAQGLDGGNFSEEYIHEKMRTIVRLANQAVQEGGSK